MNIIQRFTEQELQRYLNRHIKIASKELKKAAYGRKRGKFINISEIKFRFSQFKTEQQCLGQYFANNNSFEIVINESLLDETKSLYRLNREIVEVIKHEMIHHYVNLMFDFNREDYRFTNDSSPIFLAYIQFLNAKSHHVCYSYYTKYSQLAARVRACRNFDEFENMMIDLCIEYKEVFRKLERDYTLDTKFINEFSFGCGKTIALEKTSMDKLDNWNKLEESYYLISNNFYIGPMVSPNMLDNLYKRKRYNYNLENTTIKYTLDSVLDIKWYNKF